MFDGVGHRIPNVSFEGGGAVKKISSILFYFFSLTNVCVSRW